MCGHSGKENIFFFFFCGFIDSPLAYRKEKKWVSFAHILTLLYDTSIYHKRVFSDDDQSIYNTFVTVISYKCYNHL